ncbi:PREDICTED: GATA transcription factor 11-like [Camelina sativa]|uniref:GATA transcription factor 11-like n=1 Tax=Camelina sativa TaxID=90675 RepID=A0ABM0WSM0_CAMSA|nr:PREDICTED: GATA transcription factor 11-like [Camelina sativa]XP_010475586.1 PREDICTED: GATA transcription factor 11-like [Camelina sativa]
MGSMNWLPEQEEDFKGILSDDFFDDLINNLDCPLDEDDIDTTNAPEDWVAKFQDLEPPPMDMFPSLPSHLTSLAKPARLAVPPFLVQKQSSSSEALSGIHSSTLNQSSSPPDIKVSKLFQSSSPVSVLVNSCDSLSPQNSRSQGLAFPVKGIRSKRRRPTTMRLNYLFPFDEPKKPEKFTPGESRSQSYYSSEQHAKKKRKIQLTATHTVSSSFEAINSDGIVRKCTHCETTKTPQWREGPNGPKTLCNACGVRFRSGRLVPEYRPASSPTFIPSVHSNSHRKIIEMRRKDDNQFDTSMMHAVISGA